MTCKFGRIRKSPIRFGFPGSSNGKEFSYNVRDLGSILGLGRSPGVENAIHSSILAWKITRTEEHGRLQTMGSQRVRHDCVTNTHFSSFHYKENNTGTARWKRCIGQGMRGGDAQLSYLLQAPRLTCQGLQVFTVLPLITFDFLVTNSHPEATQEPHPESPL